VVEPPAQLARSTDPRYQLRDPLVSEKKQSGRFEFGSYGRVVISSDLRGRTGRDADIVSNGTRIDENNYAELELRREDEISDRIKTKVVGTLAFFDPFFHFTAKINQAIAVRNLFAQAQYDNWTVWAGSRMYRGDDIYLLNWWPLDNQNTVGGGVGVKMPPATGDTTIAAHVGMQRLDNPYQYQVLPFVAPFNQFGTVDVTYLDRPRTIETLKVTHLVRNTETRRVFAGESKQGFKVIGYGELHQVAAGTFYDRAIQQDRRLPSDFGWMLGSELAYWTGERDTFVQVFFRHARGLAAYDPLAVPYSFAFDRSVGGASESLVAVGGNWEKERFAILFGAYLKWFRDANNAESSLQKYDEGNIVVRPQVFFGEHFGLAVEGSYQQRRHATIDPSTDQPLTASLLRAGVMPFFSPTGRGSYKRPQFRLIYSITSRNAGTRQLYPQEDVFAVRKVEHFIGLGAEWWFNSSSYP
jgi:maltoporin